MTTMHEEYSDLRERVKEVEVTLRELVRVVDRLVTDYEGRVRQLEQRTDQTSVVADHEVRLRNVEAWRWRMVGAALALGGASGTGGAALVLALAGKA